MNPGFRLYKLRKIWYTGKGNEKKENNDAESKVSFPQTVDIPQESMKGLCPFINNPQDRLCRSEEQQKCCFRYRFAAVK